VVGLEPGQVAPRILVAEDTEESRTLMVRLLEEVGFEVREAVDGREAVAVFEEYQPHFIWMDIRMPVMDGLEATCRIKATPAGKSTIVAALTAHALEEEREPILAAGCDDLVRKPYREQEIFEVMAHHLGVRYVYERDPAAGLSAKPKADLNPEDLAALPPALRKELCEAVLRLNIARTFDSIEKIAARDARLGAALRTLAESMDYHRLLVLVEETSIDARRGV
jgi:CheY-like chemotaxis protein